MVSSNLVNIWLPRVLLFGQYCYIADIDILLFPSRYICITGSLSQVSTNLYNATHYLMLIINVCLIFLYSKNLEYFNRVNWQVIILLLLLLSPSAVGQQGVIVYYLGHLCIHVLHAFERSWTRGFFQLGEQINVRWNNVRTSREMGGGKSYDMVLA